MVTNNLARAAIAAIALSLGVLGCGDKEKAAAEAAAAASAKAADEARTKAAADAKAAADKLRTDAVAKVQKSANLDDDKIKYLKDKAAKATGAQKSNAAAAVAEVDKRREAVTSAIDKLSAGSDGWEALKTSADGALGDLSKAIAALEAALAKK